MNDKIKINLQMAGASYPLTINREDEEKVREAAKQVDIRLNAYKVQYHYGLSTVGFPKKTDRPPWL